MVIAALVLNSALILAAQPAAPETASATVARFAVASIRRPAPDAPQLSGWHVSPGGDVEIRAVPLISIITAAYDVRGFQVSGLPDWAMVDRYDIAAKVGEQAGGSSSDSTALLRARLRSLLAERCHLIVERGVKDQTGLALEVGPKGPKMPHADPHNANPQTLRRPFGIKSDQMTMAELVSTLSTIVQAPVTDRTGLTGAFKVSLTYSESPEMGARHEQAEPVTLYEALRDQLGLRLVKRTVPTPVIMIKHIERPSAN